MKRLTSDEIRGQFNKQSSEGDTLYTQGLVALSDALDALNKEGIDCELTLLGCATEQGFQLHPGDNVIQWGQTTGGILRIGNSQHLVSIITRVKLKSDGDDAKWRDCMLLCVSKFDIRYQGQNSTLRTEVYQIVDGNDDLCALQSFIIAKAANDAIISASDPHGVFTRHTGAASRSTLIKKTQPGA